MALLVPVVHLACHRARRLLAGETKTRSRSLSSGEGDRRCDESLRPSYAAFLLSSATSYRFVTSQGLNCSPAYNAAPQGCAAMARHPALETAYGDAADQLPELCGLHRNLPPLRGDDER